MTKVWSDEAWEEFEYWCKNDKKTFNKILKIIKDIERNGYKGIGKPEPLKHDLNGYWSRRIDNKNRVVYKIQDNEIKFAQCGSHYKDK